jgi:hypothetical protein
MQMAFLLAERQQMVTSWIFNSRSSACGKLQHHLLDKSLLLLLPATVLLPAKAPGILPRLRLQLQAKSADVMLKGAGLLQCKDRQEHPTDLGWGVQAPIRAAVQCGCSLLLQQKHVVIEVV